MLHRLLDRLETTPGQEKTIREALDQFLDEARSTRRAFRATREQVSRAVEQPVFEPSALDAVFREHDVLIDGLRRSAVEAFGKIHETLDARQRKTLADLIDAGPLRACFV